MCMQPINCCLLLSFFMTNSRTVEQDLSLLNSFQGTELTDIGVGKRRPTLMCFVLLKLQTVRQLWL